MGDQPTTGGVRLTGRCLSRACADSAPVVRTHGCPGCGVCAPHVSRWHAEAIAAELVRLTLGGRGPERPELRPLMHVCLLDYHTLLAGKRDDGCPGCASLGMWPLAAVQHAERLAQS